MFPGFYFDDHRNRYFPGSPPAPRRPPPVVAVAARPARLKLLHHPPLLPVTPANAGYSDRYCAHIASTSRFDLSPASTFGDITHFCSSSVSPTRRYLGDSKGWLYSSSSYQSSSSSSDSTPDLQMYIWPPEINLHSHSQVSSVNISGQYCVATCFGPVSRIAVQNTAVSGRTTLITLNQVHDVRTSHLLGSQLILGAKGRAVYLPDIDISESTQILRNRQNSDIFAIDRNERLVYLGARNGSLTRHDLRIPLDESNGQWLYSSKNTKVPSSVLYLRLIQDYQLLVSKMNGELCTYDTRFPLQNVPITSFKGHCNTISPKLGICVDPAQNFLVAAGEDGRIRGWSLRTGKALNNDSTAPSVTQTSDFGQFRNPFKAKFPVPVSTMQIVEENGNDICLWVGCRQTLYRYFLGQVSLER